MLQPHTITIIRGYSILAIALAVGGSLAWYGKHLLTKGYKQQEEHRKIDKVKNIQDSTTTFTDIVNILESQLVSEDTKIMHSEAVKDQETDEYRNVPLLLERQEGVHKIKIAIEPVEIDQPLKVEDIDVYLAKYRALNISNIVLVSLSGFSSAAYKKAEAANIQLLSFQEALKTNWSKTIHSLKNIEVKSYVIPYLVKVTGIFPRNANLPKGEINYLDSNLINPQGKVESTLLEWAEKKIQDKNIIKALDERELENGSYTLETTIALKSGCVLQPSSNIKIPITAVKITAKYKIETKIINLEKATYGDAQIALGSADSMGHKTLFVFSEQESKPAKVGLQIRKISEKMKKIVPSTGHGEQ